MDEIKRLMPAQRARCNRLIRRLCANYDGGNCLPLARPLPDGGYKLISGHRRLAACQVLGVETMPVIVRELSDDEAVIAMVDANLQRELMLPSKKAVA